ncbi:tubulin cofactor a [Salpingoeca rosetta]|uniref:Tubulin-specific chaperone A n=1 Tax=Salpingoeca rosetta (strain ATCC 50818 / BSB-021) TaxID=946362 RepID=F2UI40_SALR5|nr:tubulin cofactor a [Salpingoeca rosetta]EGD76789.1 tubulin cofactor a [Salpingoeca rosetta]|eukprot:XP_004991161.1 tubulin cofactor a [Salpingoeca rosetta]
MADPRLRQIKIKTGVVKRLGKEREVNLKEIAQQEKRIQKYKDEGRDEYDIKKQYEVLEECKMMVPDTEQRLKKAHDELTAMLESEKDLSEAEEYKAAKQMLADVTVE